EASARASHSLKGPGDRLRIRLAKSNCSTSSTVSGDGAVPVHFRIESGNATDDRSHRETWDLLCKLTGRRDFLYVADCKLATAENMAHIHQHGGRFLSVLPRTRSEDAAFRVRVVRGQVDWRHIHDKRDD